MLVPPKPGDLKGTLKHIRNEFENKLCHRLINDIAEAISKDMSDNVKIELPPPTGRQNNQDMIKLSIVYAGDATDEQKAKIREVLQKYKNPAYLGGK